jgi:predicted alpha/beta superfamily hydrolase
MKKIFFSLSFVIFFCFKSNAQQAEQTPFTIGVVDKIFSKELGESRTLNIYLPEGYSRDSSKKYPVIYLLDGSANEDFLHIVGLVQFLTMIEKMPKSIVVGIANIDRRRDFTFPTTIAADKKDFPTTGSSEKFISFLEKELEPFIDKNFKTDSSKTIIGQSLGGLLATEILLKKPYLFDDYIIVSPSIWWDNESLLNAAPALLKKQDNKKHKIYISTGEQEEKQMIDDAKKLSDLLTSTKNNSQIFYVPLANENHLTILHNSVYKALWLLNNVDSSKK